MGATKQAKFDLAQQCLHEAQDHGGLLLMATAAGNADMVAKLGLQAEQAGKNNVSFLSYFMLGQLEKCLQVLLDSKRIPEAAFFARTYLPSEISRIVELWREELSKVNEKAGQSLADPKDYPNLFPDYNASLAAQQMLTKERSKVIPAGDFLDILPNSERKPLEEVDAADEDLIDEQVDSKDHPLGGAAGAPGLETQLSGDGDDESQYDFDEDLDDLEIDNDAADLGGQSKPVVDDLEAELEADLDNLKLDDIDTTDVNLDDEELLED